MRVRVSASKNVRVSKYLTYFAHLKRFVYSFYDWLDLTMRFEILALKSMNTC